MAAKRAQTIPAPGWWVAEVAARVQTGRGRRRADDGRMLQTDLSDALTRRYGARGAYHPSEISRCVLGAVVPLEMATQISDVLDIARPCFIAASALEAEALALAAQSPEMVLGLARRIVAAAQVEPSHRSTPSGVRPPQPTTQGVQPEHGEAPSDRATRAERAVRAIMERVGVIDPVGDLSRARQPAPLRSSIHGEAKDRRSDVAKRPGSTARRPRH